MRRFVSGLLGVATLCTLAFAILPINAEDKSDRDRMEVVVYPIADLPLYHQQSTDFKPEVLIALMKATCQDFDQLGGRIVPHEKTVSLVVLTTRENHRRIAEGLQSLRKSLGMTDSREEVKHKPATGKLILQSQRPTLPPDPLLEQLRQQAPRHLVNIPLDLELLTDQFAPRTAPRVWRFTNQPDLPTDRDYWIGGAKLTR